MNRAGKGYRGLPRMSERGARRKLEWWCIKLGVWRSSLGVSAQLGRVAVHCRMVRVAAQVVGCVWAGGGGGGGGGRLTGMLGVC